jgi:6-phosphogluconate dehydrogenase
MEIAHLAQRLHYPCPLPPTFDRHHCNEISNLMVDPEFARALNARQSSLRKVVELAAKSGIPALAFSSALAYYDAYRARACPPI